MPRELREDDSQKKSVERNHFKTGDNGDVKKLGVDAGHDLTNPESNKAIMALRSSDGAKTPKDFGGKGDLDFSSFPDPYAGKGASDASMKTSTPTDRAHTATPIDGGAHTTTPADGGSHTMAPADGGNTVSVDGGVHDTVDGRGKNATDGRGNHPTDGRGNTTDGQGKNVSDGKDNPSNGQGKNVTDGKDNPANGQGKNVTDGKDHSKWTPNYDGKNRELVGVPHPGTGHLDGEHPPAKDNAPKAPEEKPASSAGFMDIFKSEISTILGGGFGR